MMRGLARWLDRRLHLAKFAAKAMNHVFPDHWSFMLGEIALYSFVVLVITGTFLAIFFDSSGAKVIYEGSYAPLRGVQMSAAYRSVLHISFDVRAGLLIRQMHHWASLIFIAAIVAHLCRIYFTAAYRRPREINWVVGLTLLILAITNGYFGYSLPDDLLSGLGLRVGYSIVLSIPVIGNWLAYLFFGGNIPTDATSPRFYSFHIFLVPALISLLIGLHVLIIWRQLHTNYPGPRRTVSTIVGSRLWPTYAIKSIALFCGIFGIVALLGGVMQIDPVWIYGPYNPIASQPGAQPDWYLGWIEGAMRLFPGVNLRFGHHLVPELFFPAVLLPGLLFGGMYLFPFVVQLFSFDSEPKNVLLLPWQQPFRTALGCTVLMFLFVLLCAGGDDVIAVYFNASVVSIRMWLRVLVFAAPAFTGAVVFWLCRRTARKNNRKMRAASSS